MCKNHASCNDMTFGFCSLLITHENTKLTVMIHKQTQKRLRHNNDRKSQKRQKNWKSTRGVAPTKNVIILVVTVTGWGVDLININLSLSRGEIHEQNHQSQGCNKILQTSHG